jgi:hypothetical protein
VYALPGELKLPASQKANFDWPLALACAHGWRPLRLAN